MNAEGPSHCSHRPAFGQEGSGLPGINEVDPGAPESAPLGSRAPDASDHPVADQIALELWEAAQRKHGTRKFASGRPWHSPYLLSGLIEYGHCGKRFQTQRRAVGRIAAYYLCGGYVASGASVCPSPRIRTSYLEDAVLDGIQKRLDRLLDPSEVRRRLRLAVAAARPPRVPVPELEALVKETQRKIGRLVDALAAGPEDLQPVRSALVRLDAERHRLERELDDTRRRESGGDQSPDAVIDGLVASLGDVREILAAGTPEERKAVVRGFRQGIRIERAQGRAVLRWYRLPQDWFAKLAAGGAELNPPISTEDEALPLPASRRGPRR